MKKITKLFLSLALCVSVSAMFTGCLSLDFEEPAPVSNEINKVVFIDPDTSVDGSKSFTLKLDEIDSTGKVLESNVIFPTMVSFSQSYHQREFNVKGKVTPGKLYKVVITSANDATPIVVSNVDENNAFKAQGGYDYRVEYYGKKTDSNGKVYHSFAVAKIRN